MAKILDKLKFSHVALITLPLYGLVLLSYYLLDFSRGTTSLGIIAVTGLGALLIAVVNQNVAREDNSKH